MNALPTLLALSLLPVAAFAQREAATVDFQKRKTTIEYGAVRVGKHTLEELPTGGTWRLGMNFASVWRTELPLLVGDRVLPPGAYRTNLQRIDEKTCAVFAQGSAMAYGGGGSGDVRIEGQLGTAKKASKKLEIDWQKGKASKLAQPATLHVQFGQHSLSGEATLLAGASARLGRYKLTVFAVPAEVVASRAKHPVPVAVVTRGKDESWNVVLHGDEARLVPFMEAPTSSFGFGEIEAPDEAKITRGTVVEEEVDQRESVAALELRESSADDDRFVLAVATGRLVLTVTVPEPPAKKSE